MALNIQITDGILGGAQRVVLYGPEGIGKTTFASMFPDPVFCDTEGSTRRYNLRRTPCPKSWTEIRAIVAYFIQYPDRLGTFVLDTADWAERLCIDHICAVNKQSGLEGFGYGKGYVYEAEEFGRLLDDLTALSERNVHILLNAHAQMRKFEQPDELGSYDRWEMKLTKKVAPMVKEWADMVLFANYQTYVVNVDGQGTTKGRNKVQGGRRIMKTAHHPCWDAKNRENLPEEMDFDFTLIAHLFPGKTISAMPETDQAAQPKGTCDVVQETQAHAKATGDGGKRAPGGHIPEGDSDPKDVNRNENVARAGQRAMIEVADIAEKLPSAASIPEVSAPPPEQPAERMAEPPAGIPPALYALMRQDGVTEEEIMFAVAGKGYFPGDTPIRNYPPDFVQGVLIGAWPQVRGMVLANREEVPF